MASTTPTRGMLATQVQPVSTFSLILKTPVPPGMATKTNNTLHLSALDQNIVRVYTQALLLFPFSDGNQAELAIATLVNGLKETVKQFPFLAGTLKLGELGKLCLTYPTEVVDPRETALFAHKNVPFGPNFPHTYEELKKQGMPPSAFKPEIFCPDDLRKYRGMPPDAEGIVDCSVDPVPVLRVQANFIPGGLVLSTYCHHTLMDCSGVNIFWKSYARNISNISHFRPSKVVPSHELLLRTDESERRNALDQRVHAHPSRSARAEAEAYCKGTYKYETTLPPINTSCSLRYFVIPAQRMRDYRQEIKQHFPADSQPTICNLLAALVWIHVTRARAARLPHCREQETRIGVATDLRRRSHPKMDEDDYMGNMALFSTGALKIADIVAAGRVTDQMVTHTVREIKRTISKVDNDWILQHLSFFQSIEEIEDTECALGFRFGLDIYITSWMNFGGDIEWGIPGTDLTDSGLHGRPDYIRRTYGPSDGGMMIMPRRRHLANGEDAPYEVMVRLATVDMERLLNDPDGLSSWAERVIH